jgi:FtsH-binding integral membrane protein
MVYNGVLMIEEEAHLAKTFSNAMGRVYLWMSGGLAVTAIVAMLVAASEGLAAAIFGNWFTAVGLFVAQMALVTAIATRIDKLAPDTALRLFFVYSGLMGVTLSVVFLTYHLGAIWMAFGATSATFAAMAMVGLTTKKDLASWGPALLAALFGLIIASVSNWFLKSGFLEWVVSFAGVLIFMGLTVHDSQAIKTMTAKALAEGDTQTAARVGVLGALNLYLNFLNIFLYLLSFMGRNED